jgi:6-phosphogluconolactonase
MAVQALAADKASELFFIGTHGTPRPSPTATADTSANATASAEQGIYAGRLETKTGHLSSLGVAAELERATWLVMNPGLPVIYSVADSGGGFGAESNIYSFAVDQTSGKLREINQVPAGGVDATHLDLDRASNTLFSANFASGNVTALPLLSDGSLGPMASSQKGSGSGPNKRQKGPVAHGVAVDPTHHYVLVADFGADRVLVYRFDGATRALTPAQTPFEAVPPGSGPRHMVFHPNGRFLYLVTELTAEIRAYTWDPKNAQLHLVQTLSPYAADYSGEKSAGEITVSRDGRFLYLSLRGDQNSIVAYALNKQTGTLKEIQRVPAQGEVPWSFGIDPTGHWMLVTNDRSSSVNEFAVDTTTGKLSPTKESLSIPNPVAVVFYPK